MAAKEGTVTPPSSPKRLRRQAIQPWWILVFAFLQTFVFVYVGLPPTGANEIRWSSLVNRQNQQQQTSPIVAVDDESKPPIQRSLEEAGDDEVLAVDPRQQRLERRLKKLVNATLVTACQRIHQVGDDKKFVTRDVCHQETNEHIVVYNPASYSRIWCDKTIPAKGFIHLKTTSSCRQEPPRIFAVDPTVEGTDMPAIHVEPFMPRIYLKSFQNKQKQRNVTDIPCDIPCRKTVGADVFTGTDYRILGTDLKILQSLESSQYYGNLRVKDDAFRENQYYSTTSFRSEVPVPYFSLDDHDIRKPAVDYETAIRGASFIARNCDSRSSREDVVRELMKYIRVDSLGECLHNAEPPGGLRLEGGQDSKKKVMRSYLFHLAFENSQEEDYVTEKLWGALESGTLPVYFGAPNVKEHAPAPQSIISWHDFNDTVKLVEYIKKVAANKTLYESHHEWRQRPLSESFRRKFDFTRTHSMCRTCRWAYSKMHGLGFDHASQTVQDVALSRKVKYDTTSDRVIHPFREVSELPADCWTRRVWEHDGVIDIHFESLNATHNDKTVSFQMETTIRGSYREMESNVFVLQNDASRITLIASWDAVITEPEPGVVDIALDSSFVLLRLRVLVEDVDTVHKGADRTTNYFGDRMTKDFLNPLQTFRVVGGNLTAVDTL